MGKLPGTPRLCCNFSLLLGLLVVAVLLKHAESQCANRTYQPTPNIKPNIQLPAPDGTSAFWFFLTQVQWCTAEASCKEHGGHLASVLTSAENDLVMGTCFNKLLQGSDPQVGCWIGLNDIVTEGDYAWSDGSSVYYTNWYSGAGFQQPDDATQPDQEDCVFMFKAFAGWHDRDCNAQYSYVCRIPVRANTTSATNATTPAAAASTPAAVESATPAAAQPATATHTPPPPTAPAPAPPADNGHDWKIVVATVAPILTGVAALVAIAYTGWKWWHKRQATLTRKQASAAANPARPHRWLDDGFKRVGVKPVDAV